MFKAVNTEMENISSKINEECENMKKEYLLALKNKKFKEILSYNVIYEENNYLNDQIKSNIIYSYVKYTPLKKIEESVINDNKNAFFLFLRRNISVGKYLKSKQLLNFAAEKKWFVNEYYELLDLLYEMYY